MGGLFGSGQMQGASTGFVPSDVPMPDFTKPPAQGAASYITSTLRSGGAAKSPVPAPPPIPLDALPPSFASRQVSEAGARQMQRGSAGAAAQGDVSKPDVAKPALIPEVASAITSTSRGMR